MYRVTKRYARGPESLVANYKTQAEATQVIQEKLAEDALLKVNATYCIYEGADLVDEFDQSKLVASTSAKEDTTSQSPGSGQRSSPTPFATAPRPSGMPSSWGRSDSKSEDKK